MPVKNGYTSRANMSSRERHLRSQLNKLIGAKAIVRGTLLSRERSCGRPTCRCAQGKRHPALLLVVREDGRQRQIFIPKSMEDEVRLWVAQYQKVRSLQDDLSRIYVERIKRREI